MDYTTARVAVLTALPSPTKADKKELKTLRSLAKSLGKTQLALKGDFAELSTAAKASAALKTAGAPMQASLDEGFVRAGLSLSERVELTNDHLKLLSIGKHIVAVQSLLNAVTTARGQAAAVGLAASKRAALLVKADASLTKALKAAEKYVLSDVGADVLPPTRWRSGDTMDQHGGRVAVPRDSGSAVAGASIVIQPNILQQPTVVTLSAGASFVTGRDVPAGPALAVTPDGLPAVGTVVFVPYQVPEGSSAQDLSLFAKGPPVAAIRPSAFGSDGMMSASVASFSTFQAGLAGSPPGQPSGPYHVQMILVATALDPSNHDIGGVLAGVFDETMTFRADHTASTTSPTLQILTRTFKTAAPHHLDASPPTFAGSIDFAWTEVATGQFTFTFPLDTTTQAQARGVASADGRVLSFSGRGGLYEFFGVGVKGGTGLVTADLSGRWAAVETGVQFLGGGVEPFTTRRHDAMRVFTADTAGVLTYDTQGSRFETDVTYHTDSADPTHDRVENVVADSGSETWSVGINGKIAGVLGTRSGWLDKTSGVLVAATYDGTTRRASLMVATPQPALAVPSAFVGLHRLAGLDVGATTGTPTSHSSTLETTPGYGSLDVHSSTSATLAFDAATRASYTLSGEPSGAAITWSMTSASAALSASSTDLTLSLDAAGNHRAPTDERWFAFSGDGKYVLVMTRGEATRLDRGIALGMK